MREDWAYVTLGDHFPLASGKPVPADRTGEVPIFGGNGVNGGTKTPLTSEATIVIGRVGENCGSVHLSRGPSWITDNALWVKSFGVDWDLRFVAAYLQFYNLNRLKNRTGQPLVSQEQICRVRLPMPPLAEQQRISEVLDEVDTQIQLSLDEVRKISAAQHSVLRRMLSEPLRSLRQHEVSRVSELAGETTGSFQFVALGDVVESIEAGNSPDLEGKPAGEGQWGVLKVSAIGRNGFLEQENKRVEDTSLIDASIEVHPGDLLITRANTPDLVGMSCVVEATRPGLMLSDKTLRLNLRPSAGDPRHLSDLLRLPEIRRQIEVAATGTSNSMKNISQEAIKSLVVPWSSVAVQEGGRKLASEFRTNSERAVSNLAKLRLIKTALMDDLLTGKVRICADTAT